MKKVFGWILGLLLSPVLLFVLLAVALYLPPVQNWAVDKVAAIASEKTGMDITVGYVRLAFPLDLSIHQFRVLGPVTTDSAHMARRDTIADVGRLVVDVQWRPLLDSRVVINELEILDTRLNTNGFIDAACVKGRFRRLYVSSRGIDLERETVEVNGTRLENASLDIQLCDSVPEDTTTSDAHWRIHADNITILHSALALHMADSTDVSASMGELAVSELLVDLGKPLYTVGDIRLTDGSVTYGDMGLRPFSLHAASVAMVGDSVRVPRLELTTPTSSIAMQVDMPLSFADSIAPTRLHFGLDASLSKRDLTPFMKELPQALVRQWPDEPLVLRGRVSGNMRRMDFDSLDVRLPSAFRVQATGYAEHLDHPEQLRADVRFKGQTQNLGFVMAMLPRDVQRNYRVPPITAEGRVQADGNQYTADVTAVEGRGRVKLGGSFNAAAQRYAAKVSVSNLNLHHFMPRDSIYTLSADVSAHGRGFDFLSPRTTMEADVQLHHLGYNKWNLDTIAATASLKDGHALVDLDSRNRLIDGHVNLDALVNSKKLAAIMATDLQKVDLYAMDVVEKPLSIGICGQFDVTSDLKLTHYITGLVGDILVRDSAKTVRSEFIGLNVRTTPDTTIVRAQSGDFIVKLDASGDYERLFSQLSQLGDTVMAQYHSRTIDQPALRRQLPTMSMHIESRRENPLSAILKSQSVQFREMSLDMSTSVATGINGNGHIHSLVASDVRLDTINFRLTQRQERLSFGGQIRNNKRNPQFVFNALFDGILQEHGATMGVRYYDSENKLGARIGFQGEMQTDGLSVHLVPERPILGYKEFSLNRGNYINFSTATGRVTANVDLRADDGMGVKFYSSSRDSTAKQDLTVTLNKFDLDEVTSVMPYAPRMAGVLNGDFHAIQDARGNFSVLSDVSVQNMSYERSPIGNVSTELVYMQKEDDSHAVEARLMKDDEEIGLLQGVYYNAGEGSLDATLKLEHLPLSLVNGFVPDQMVGLQGFGDGTLSVKGPLSKPDVNGELLLTSSYAESVPYGVKLTFDDDPVRIVNSRLLLENFTMYSLNKNPLTIAGYVDFSDMDKIEVNVRMRAKNFQVIGAKEHTKSVAYGKAFVDVFASMRGTLDNLAMRGRLNVLGTTDVGYILRDSPLTTDNQMDQLVKFTDFSDTTQTVVQRPALTGFRMDMTVDVSKGVHVMAYLNSDHSNYIDLMGGGTLRMQYSPADNLQLTGRYTLSNGEMKYALPIIPLKTFTIQDGSYVEFTGDVMNPTLNITATERTRASVTGSNGVGRSVDFDCGVQITKTLSDMGLQFTLDAPEDMQLHSELQSMGAEQRGKLAVTMLTTGMYLADGNTKPFSMNSALSSFLSSEISSLTGNALRTLDLSFGMDNTTDASGQDHTDYSFKFAKRFLNNRLKVMVGGKVTSGSDDVAGGRNKSFFDNVSMEYRLDQSANKYLSVFFQNNSYDWLDGYTQKYGAGFIWRRSLQKFTDIFRLKEPQMPMRAPMTRPSTTQRPDSTRTDSLKTTAHDKK